MNLLYYVMIMIKIHLIRSKKYIMNIRMKKETHFCCYLIDKGEISDGSVLIMI